ncbi:PP2A regulatory subunit TAP46 [Phalaenopsis equestris]|uniref:PP2A regulatory subunit TAP46 n=1 Tax=Phalaenopsis equestris TaxID=78828 RepID=UPI0009E48B4F|nr:PP2A regulatory subunit TAP46 [Phalaenopsis equestris]XP_020584808.1 PP2A regulatory subunit TAP46 [Phalaenopsis equestris]
MGDMNMEEMSLPALFELARKIYTAASDSSVDQEQLRKGIEALRSCDEMVSKLGLFSSNETVDDVSTTNLKYILVPFYLGELTEKLAKDDRIEIIRRSYAQFKEFISICEALELVPEEEIVSSKTGSTDLAAARAKKIARFKRQKAADAKLQEIKERKERRGRSLRASALSTPIEAGEEDLLDDDGEEREAWLATISLAICKAFDLLDMLKKEEEMLVAVKERSSQEGNDDFAREVLDERTQKAEMWHKTAASRAPFLKPSQPITCATFAQDVIEGRAKASEAHEHKHHPLIFGPASLIGGKLTSERERMAAQVFQPGYRLPSMSIEEAGLREMEIMNKWQERNTKLMEEANSSWHKDGSRREDEDEEDDDEAQEKARAWDDWKDDHPRGAGNKKLTPCG